MDSGRALRGRFVGTAHQPVCRRLQWQALPLRHWRRAGPEADHLSAPDALAEREIANRKAGFVARLFCCGDHLRERCTWIMARVKGRAQSNAKERREAESPPQ